MKEIKEMLHTIMVRPWASPDAECTGVVLKSDDGAKHGFICKQDKIDDDRNGKQVGSAVAF